MSYFIDLRISGSGGGVAREPLIRKGGSLISAAELAVEARGRRVLLATHGFNVNRRDGMSGLGDWEPLLRLDPGTLFIGVLWPGDSRWLPVIDYPFEGDEAMESGRLLATFLNTKLTGALSFSLASHSLGARMVLETIRHLQRRVDALVLMAGAIDDNCLVKEYKDAAAKVDRISILASRQDMVLKLAFPIGNFLGGLVSRGHPYHEAAIGRHGPETPFPPNLRSNWQLPEKWDFGHGDYLPERSLAPNPFPSCVDVPAAVHGGAGPGFSKHNRPAWAASFVECRIR